MKLDIKWEDIIHTTEQVIVKSGNNEVEPGSGSIMGYAGICDGQNVQDNSDDYNYVNIRDISAIQGGVSSTCFDEILFLI
jgi:hypothetical protein